MDLLEYVNPTLSMVVNYKAYNNLTSSVKADFFNLDNETLLVVGTEIEGNNGPSITNSIEYFAKRIKTLWPTFKNYQFIESYRWEGEKPSFDKVTFLEDDFEKPTWRRLDDGQLYDLIAVISQRQIESIGGRPDVNDSSQKRHV